MDTSYDPVSARPVLIGAAGRVWEVDLAANPEAARRADVATWVIERPDAHPFWHSYAVVLFHLRPIAGLLKPVIHRHGATHEFWVAALHPQRPRQAIIETGRIPFLGGPNFASQTISASDAEAYRVIYRDVVTPLVTGELSPHVNDVAEWIQRFGDWMVRK